MATVPVRIVWSSITGCEMWCEKHDMRIPFVPDRKAVSAIDSGNYNMCPGLEAELTAEGKFWGEHDQEIEDRDSEDRAEWSFVIDLEDATVTVG